MHVLPVISGVPDELELLELDEEELEDDELDEVFTAKLAVR